jgi:cytochrome P450
MHFDAYDPAFVRDPYPTYARLRTAAPVLHDPEWGLTFFSRHADVSTILRDRRFGRDIRHVAPESVAHRTYPTHLPNWYRLIRGSFIDLEPPEHTRIRTAVAHAFTRRRAEEWRERIRRQAEALADAAAERREVDLIADFATPIPITVVADLMGIPASDHGRLLDWSHAIVRVFDLNVTAAEEHAAETAVTEFADHLRSLIAERRRDPGDDLISELATDPEPLPDDDLVATCILVLNAGHEATVHGIGNGALALARHPEAARRLAADPGLAATATDELLRYDTPLQMFERWVLEDLEWDGHRLSRGDKVGLLFGSANRDPDAFEAPDALVLDRPRNQHVSFGGGTHFCLGAPLARIELEEAFLALAGRGITLLDPEPPRTPSLVFRGAGSLRAVVGAGAGGSR